MKRNAQFFLFSLGASKESTFSFLSFVLWPSRQLLSPESVPRIGGRLGDGAGALQDVIIHSDTEVLRKRNE